MVLTVPIKSIKDLEALEWLVITMKTDAGLIKKLFLLLITVKNFLRQISTCTVIANEEAVATSTEFYLRYSQSPGGKLITDSFQIKKEFLTNRCNHRLKYPVNLQLRLKKSVKVHLEKNIELLIQTLTQKYEELEEIDGYHVLIEVFSFVLENSNAITEYFSKPENCELSSLKSVTLPQTKKHCCAVCGTEIESTSSELTACFKCSKLYENSKPAEISAWVCKNQSGYCALIPHFQYKDHVLYYKTLTGDHKPYVSNCNALCKKCRFSRCAQIGLKRACLETQKTASKKLCGVCGSQDKVNDLNLCSPCQTFLSDSVEESSHDTITCMGSKDCEVQSVKTANFSACTGCWMFKIKNLGVLNLYLKQVILKTKNDTKDIENELINKKDNNNITIHGCSNPEIPLTKVLEAVEAEKEVESQEEKCVICRKTTSNKFQDRSCCNGCKKFFLKCAKSRCFKDFCCSGSSQCDVIGKSPCSHCWWSRCVKSGLFKSFQLEPKSNPNGLKRPLTPIISSDFLNKREKQEELKAHR